MARPARRCGRHPLGARASSPCATRWSPRPTARSLHLGADIPVRTGTEGWAFVVAHLVDEGSAIAEGDEVEIEADAATRHALSAGHTACHLASLALNRALADRWSKPAREDALGSPDFDGAAIASSRIVPDGSVDRYRLNKSLRRAGFDTASLQGDLDGLRRAVAAQLDAVGRHRGDRARGARRRRRRTHRSPLLGVRAARRHGPHRVRRHPPRPRSPSSRRSTPSIHARRRRRNPRARDGQRGPPPTLTAECRRHPPAGLR